MVSSIFINTKIGRKGNLVNYSKSEFCMSWIACRIHDILHKYALIELKVTVIEY